MRPSTWRFVQLVSMRKLDAKGAERYLDGTKLLRGQR